MLLEAAHFELGVPREVRERDAFCVALIEPAPDKASRVAVQEDLSGGRIGPMHDGRHVLDLLDDELSIASLARDSLIDRARQVGIEAIVMSPTMKDFNDDLRHFGIEALRASLADQLMRRDRFRFLNRAA